MKLQNFIEKSRKNFFYSEKVYTFAPQSESSAVGSALRSGRRGRAFESPLSDKDDDR